MTSDAENEIRPTLMSSKVLLNLTVPSISCDPRLSEIVLKQSNNLLIDIATVYH